MRMDQIMFYSNQRKIVITKTRKIQKAQFIFFYKKEKFAIAPNPANTVVTVYYETDNLETNYIELYDMQGKIRELINLPSDKNTFTFSIENLSNGVYYVKFISSNPPNNFIKLIVIR